MKITNAFAWAWKRYQLGYGFFGSILALFNFAGIFALLFDDVIPKEYSIPILMLCTFTAFGLFALIILDKLKLQTKFVEKEGYINDYWHKKINPLNRKIFFELSKAIKTDDFSEFERRLKYNDWDNVEGLK